MPVRNVYDINFIQSMTTSSSLKMILDNLNAYFRYSACSKCIQAIDKKMYIFVGTVMIVHNIAMPFDDDYIHVVRHD